jgi:hypothetical protein
MNHTWVSAILYSKRDLMQIHCQIGISAAILSAMPMFAQTQNLTPAALAARAKAQNVPEIPYESVPNLLKFPANLYLGEGIGVATNSKGHIFVYTRSQRTRLFEFDQKGNYIREIGEGLYGFVFAHAVRVDRRTTSGPSTRAPIWSSSSTPKAAW